MVNGRLFLIWYKKNRGAGAPRFPVFRTDYVSAEGLNYLEAFLAAFLRRFLAGAFFAAFFVAFFAALRFAGAFLAAFLRFFAAMIFSLFRYCYLRFGFNSLFSVELEVNFIAVDAGT